MTLYMSGPHGLTANTLLSLSFPRDIYLLDDPLSAVDACVALEIFENLILSALANKTVILVTHQVQCLSRCSDIYVMRSGRIVERGSHGDLMRYDREYAYLVKSMATRADDTVDEYAKTFVVLLVREHLWASYLDNLCAIFIAGSSRKTTTKSR